MDLEFDVDKQIITRKDKEKVVDLSENYLRLSFSFSDDWNGLSKFILILHTNGTATRLPINQGNVLLPSSLLDTNKIIFTLYGTKSDNGVVTRITTNQVLLRLLRSGYTSEFDNPVDDEVTDIVEDIYTELEKRALSEDISSIGYSGLITDAVDYVELTDNFSVSLEKQSSAEEGYFATYVIKQGNTPLSPKINIPKDYLLKDADILICEEADNPVEGLHPVK